jgi:hypothetical protein
VHALLNTMVLLEFIFHCSVTVFMNFMNASLISEVRLGDECNEIRIFSL